MAPQRSADGLLEALRETPSTRLCLVLGVAALLALAGCGGGSGDAEEGGGSATSAAAPQAEAKGKGGGERAEGTESARFAKERAAAEAAIEGRKAPGGGAGGKQGPSIKPPKGPQERAPTPQERAEATAVSMALASPVVAPGPESTGILPATHTCEGKNTPPPLQWQGTPPATRELVLFALNLEPVNEAFFFDWAVAGIDPTLTELQPGQLPKGAVQGKNGFGKNGYSVCPKGPETIIFALYAMPRPTGAKRGFDPAALREQVLGASGDAGIMAVSYSR